jgi:hypothetical protein
MIPARRGRIEAQKPAAIVADEQSRVAQPELEPAHAFQFDVEQHGTSRKVADEYARTGFF